MDIKGPYYQDEYCTIYHSDCREILPHLTGFGAVVTDPPYNCKKNYGTYKDDLTPHEYESTMRDIVGMCRIVATNQAWITPKFQLPLWLRLIHGAHLIVVRRGAQGPLRAGWSDQYSTVLTVGKPVKADRDLWDDIRLTDEGYFFKEDKYKHPGYTPTALMIRLIELLGNQSIIDPFCGTGTSLLAARRVGLQSVGIEIDEKWCEVAATRMMRNPVLPFNDRGMIL